MSLTAPQGLSKMKVLLYCCFEDCQIIEIYVSLLRFAATFKSIPNNSVTTVKVKRMGHNSKQIGPREKLNNPF